MTGLIYRPVSGARHEVYALAKTLYTQLTTPEKATLWHAIEAGPPLKWIEHIEPERRTEVWQYQIDRFVLYLYTEFPHDPAAQKPYAQLEMRAPGFVNAKHRALDQDFWFGGVRDLARCSRSVEDILMSSPEEQLDYFLNFKTEDPLEETREGLVSNVARAAGKNSAWGVQLMRALSNRDAWNSDLWNSIFWQLSFVKLPAEDQRWLLSYVEGKFSHNEIILDGITYFLFNSALFAKETSVNPDMLHNYWSERLKGRPFSLTGQEAHAMLNWVWMLPPCEFAEAVPLVLGGPEFESDGWTAMTQILESPLPAAQPSLLLELWAYILEHSNGLYVDEKDYQKLLGRLPKNPTLLDKWERVCQALSRQGASCADSLFGEGKRHFTT